MHTIYGGMTLNGIEVNDMVNNGMDYVTYKENTKFFARITQIGSINTDEPLKPGVALFYESKEMAFTPLMALEAKEGTEDYELLITDLFSMAEIVGIYDYTEKELDDLITLTRGLKGIQYKTCDATDSEGYTTEGVIEYEGREYYVYSSAYSPLSFEAECARDILLAKKSMQGFEAVRLITEFNEKELEKEIEVWYSIYMTFDDYNRTHAESAFINSHLNVIRAWQDIHKANLDFLKEIAERENDAVPFPKLREISSEFNSYLDELSVDKKMRKFNTEGDLILKKKQWAMSERFPEPKVAAQDFFELNINKKEVD